MIRVISIKTESPKLPGNYLVVDANRKTLGFADWWGGFDIIDNEDGSINCVATHWIKNEDVFAELERIAEAEKPIVNENLTDEAEFVKDVRRLCNESYPTIQPYQIREYGIKLCDIIDRQAKEITSLTKQIGLTTENNINKIKENSILRSENAKLKAALQRIINRIETVPDHNSLMLIFIRDEADRALKD